MEGRTITEIIPEHLTPFIAHQDPSLYTAMDHAAWRYIMRVSKSYFSTKAHQKYLDGLIATGISTDRIPSIQDMDSQLRKFGWRAVAVSGFIPPSAFMEFQSLGVLPIACDMRKLENLSYTPSPDIVHEAAGHAPILADREYADYLRSYGEVARKAISSDKDYAVYEAVRRLSEVKENPEASPQEILEAQKSLDHAVTENHYVSEAAYLARMFWWTVEYGLIGTPSDPLIYGAGLLSSVGESRSCLSEDVQKIPFTLDCVNMSYDITKPQPQLYVARDFPSLKHELEAFASRMAFKVGGTLGLTKAKTANVPTTIVLNSGLQMSGVLDEFICDASGLPAYLQMKGPTQLSYQDTQLEGHSVSTHREGFGTPVGKIATLGKSPSELSDAELEGFRRNDGITEILFSSGVKVAGRLKSKLSKVGRLLILTFDDCTASMGDRILFRPEWGSYDMACGSKVSSVFGGPADRTTYLRDTGALEYVSSRQKTNLTRENSQLNKIYEKIRSVRESKKSPDELLAVIDELDKSYPEDWLARLELVELFNKAPNLKIQIDRLKKVLQTISKKDANEAKLITQGLELIEGGKK